jgi:hypothetical protein
MGCTALIRAGRPARPGSPPAAVAGPGPVGTRGAWSCDPTAGPDGMTMRDQEPVPPRSLGRQSVAGPARRLDEPKFSRRLRGMPRSRCALLAV